jgi:hypothetical protein
MRVGILLNRANVGTGRERLCGFGANDFGDPMSTFRHFQQSSEDAQDASTLLVAVCFAVLGLSFYVFV